MRTVDFTGTVSEATMLTRDLVPKFMAMLGEYHPDAHSAIIDDMQEEFGIQYASLHECGAMCETDNYLQCVKHNEVWRSEAMSYILNEDIWDAMNEIAPAGYYFGSHPGDGCDYGYWRVECNNGCWHEWLRHKHSIDGWIYWCPLCHTIAEYNGHKQPCVQCGDEPVQDTRFCTFCDGR